MKKLFIPFLFLALAGFFASWSGKDANPVLTVEGGQIKGVPTPTKGIIAYVGENLSQYCLGKA
jgi:para-nitrobenzyl esterase